MERKKQRIDIGEKDERKRQSNWRWTLLMGLFLPE